MIIDCFVYNKIWLIHFPSPLRTNGIGMMSKQNTVSRKNFFKDFQAVYTREVNAVFSLITPFCTTVELATAVNSQQYFHIIMKLPTSNRRRICWHMPSLEYSPCSDDFQCHKMYVCNSHHDRATLTAKRTQLVSCSYESRILRLFNPNLFLQ